MGPGQGFTQGGSRHRLRPDPEQVLPPRLGAHQDGQRDSEESSKNHLGPPVTRGGGRV